MKSLSFGGNYPIILQKERTRTLLEYLELISGNLVKMSSFNGNQFPNAFNSLALGLSRDDLKIDMKKGG